MSVYTIITENATYKL